MHRIVIPLLLALTFVVPSDAQDDSSLTPAERWERMDAAQRDLLRDRFMQFLKFSPEERERIKEEVSRIENRRERSVRGLSERERILLDELEPDLRRRIIRELFRQRSLEDGSRVRDKLPPNFLRELEEADESERGSMFREFLRERRLGGGRRLLFHLGSELDVPTEERETWNDLDVEEQSAKLLELGRVFIRQRVGELGPPSGLSDGEWARVDSLDDQDFFEVWRRLAPPADYLPDPAKAASEAEVLDSGSEAARGVLEERPGVARAEERRKLMQQWRDLRDLARLDVSDYVAMAELSPSEQTRELNRMIRERTLEHIRVHELLDEEVLETLEALEGRAYRNSLARVMRAHFSRR